MAKSRFLFTLARDKKPGKRLSSSPNKPVISNLTPLRILLKRSSRRKKGYVPLEYIPKASTQWPASAKCYLQIWEVDKWKKGRSKKEHDAKAKSTGNDLVKEICGYIKQDSGKSFMFVADKPVKSAAGAPKNNKTVTLMIDTLESGKVSKKKVSLTVTGEPETCFEIGLACETVSSPTKYQNKFSNPVVHILAFDDCICYVGDPKNPTARCGKDRIHYYVESKIKKIKYCEDYYQLQYKKLPKTKFTSLESEASFEEILRAIGKDLKSNAGKTKKIGDLIIATHADLHIPTDTIMMRLPLIGTGIKGRLGEPSWTKKPPNHIGAPELDKLIDPNEEWYKHVNQKGSIPPLITGVLKSINARVDSGTHVWLVGCNVGLNVKLMKSMRKVFDDKPKVYAFTDQHHFKIWPKHGYPKTRGRETLVATTKHQKVWTAKGAAKIVEVP